MKMILADGTELSDLSLNGNNYVSKTEITEDIFEDNLETVTIEDEEETTELHNAELVYVKTFGDEWWFVLKELSDAELKELSNDAQIFYTAVMTDTLMEG